MNNNARFFLWLALGLVLWLNYIAWQRDYGPESPQAVAAQAAADAAPALGASVPMGMPAAAASPGAGPALSTAPAASAVPAPAGPPAAAPVDARPASTAAGEFVRVRTDVLDLDINLVGGELVRADLLKYPVTKGGSTPVRLFHRPENGVGFYSLQTGLAGPEGAARPTHLAAFAAAQRKFQLGDGQEALRVPLTWSDGAVTVTKTFVFRRGRYDVRLEYLVDNRGEEPWAAASYAQILRDDLPVERSMFNVESYAFKGPAYFDGEKYTKLKLDSADDRALSRDIRGGWIAGMQHHFVSAVVPSAEAAYRYTLGVQGQQYLLTVAGPLRTVAPGSTQTFAEQLFVGPKLQAQLEETGPELYRVADYGVLTLLAKPLFIALQWVHDVTGNWGWAIILVTFLLKLAFYPLSEASGKSMAKMRVLAPRMKQIQETYKDDREKLGKAMMELYQREKINPLAGCLPILVQMPVFFAFYWVLLESVEMRQAPFLGWIQDLSARDPFFILPVIMAGAMFVQYKLNPTPPDPIQAKVFMILPIVMSVTFAFFPAGLVLYWVTNTVLSIAQQWNINRRIEAAAAAGKRVA